MSKSFASSFGWAIALCAMFAAGPAAAGPPATAPGQSASSDKLDRGLREALSGAHQPSRVRVIIRVDANSRAALKQSLIAQGHGFKKEHRLVSALTMEVPTTALRGIANMPGVTTVSLDAKMTSTATP